MLCNYWSSQNSPGLSARHSMITLFSVLLVVYSVLGASSSGISQHRLPGRYKEDAFYEELATMSCKAKRSLGSELSDEDQRDMLDPENVAFGGLQNRIKVLTETNCFYYWNWDDQDRTNLPNEYVLLNPHGENLVKAVKQAVNDRKDVMDMEFAERSLRIDTLIQDGFFHQNKPVPTWIMMPLHKVLPGNQIVVELFHDIYAGLVDSATEQKEYVALAVRIAGIMKQMKDHFNNLPVDSFQRRLYGSIIIPGNWYRLYLDVGAKITDEEIRNGILVIHPAGSGRGLRRDSEVPTLTLVSRVFKVLEDFKSENIRSSLMKELYLLLPKGEFAHVHDRPIVKSILEGLSGIVFKYTDKFVDTFIRCLKDLNEQNLNDFAMQLFYVMGDIPRNIPGQYFSYQRLLKYYPAIGIVEKIKQMGLVGQLEAADEFAEHGKIGLENPINFCNPLIWRFIVMDRPMTFLNRIPSGEMLNFIGAKCYRDLAPDRLKILQERGLLQRLSPSRFDIIKDHVLEYQILSLLEYPYRMYLRSVDIIDNPNSIINIEPNMDQAPIDDFKPFLSMDPINLQTFPDNVTFLIHSEVDREKISEMFTWMIRIRFVFYKFSGNPGNDCLFLTCSLDRVLEITNTISQVSTGNAAYDRILLNFGSEGRGLCVVSGLGRGDSGISEDFCRWQNEEITEADYFNFKTDFYRELQDQWTTDAIDLLWAEFIVTTEISSSSLVSPIITPLKVFWGEILEEHANRYFGLVNPLLMVVLPQSSLLPRYLQRAFVTVPVSLDLNEGQISKPRLLLKKVAEFVKENPHGLQGRLMVQIPGGVDGGGLARTFLTALFNALVDEGVGFLTVVDPTKRLFIPKFFLNPAMGSIIGGAMKQNFIVGQLLPIGIPLDIAQIIAHPRLPRIRTVFGKYYERDLEGHENMIREQSRYLKLADVQRLAGADYEHGHDLYELEDETSHQYSESELQTFFGGMARRALKLFEDLIFNMHKAIYGESSDIVGYKIPDLELEEVFSAKDLTAEDFQRVFVRRGNIRIDSLLPDQQITLLQFIESFLSSLNSDELSMLLQAFTGSSTIPIHGDVFEIEFEPPLNTLLLLDPFSFLPRNEAVSRRLAATNSARQSRIPSEIWMADDVNRILNEASAAPTNNTKISPLRFIEIFRTAALEQARILGVDCTTDQCDPFDPDNPRFWDGPIPAFMIHTCGKSIEMPIADSWILMKAFLVAMSVNPNSYDEVGEHSNVLPSTIGNTDPVVVIPRPSLVTTSGSETAALTGFDNHLDTSLTDQTLAGVNNNAHVHPAAPEQSHDNDPTVVIGRLSSISTDDNIRIAPISSGPSDWELPDEPLSIPILPRAALSDRSPVSMDYHEIENHSAQTGQISPGQLSPRISRNQPDHIEIVPSNPTPIPEMPRSNPGSSENPPNNPRHSEPGRTPNTPPVPNSTSSSSSSSSSSARGSSTAQMD